LITSLAALRRVCRSDPNPAHCLALALEEAEHLPSKLRKSLAGACRSKRPIYSVNQLAAAAGCDRRTLWKQWIQVVGSSSELRLQDFLHWLLLLRAVGRKVSERSWESIAGDLNVHPHTLARWAKQLTGRTLGALVANGTAVVGTMLHQRVMDFVLADKSLDKL
jgi:transposase-like protein